LNGTDSATPLLFDIFNSIDYNSTDGWFQQPKGIGLRAVCAESGNPANSFCQNQVLDTFIPGISSTQKCSHLKRIAVSADKKYSYCTSCQPATGFVQELYPNHAPELLTFYDAERIPYQQI